MQELAGYALPMYQGIYSDHSVRPCRDAVAEARERDHACVHVTTCEVMYGERDG